MSTQTENILRLLFYVKQTTVKPVLRGHIWDKEKVTS
jgi:hypothetical protein